MLSFFLKKENPAVLQGEPFGVTCIKFSMAANSTVYFLVSVSKFVLLGYFDECVRYNGVIRVMG